MLGCGLAIIGVRGPSGGRGVAGAVWVSHASTIIILLCFAEFMIYLLLSGFLLDHDFCAQKPSILIRYYCTSEASALPPPVW